MINPYAQSFMIAARTDRFTQPAGRIVRDARAVKRRFGLFRRLRGTSPETNEAA